MKKILFLACLIAGSLLFEISSQTVKAATTSDPSAYTATAANGLGTYAFDTGQTLDGRFFTFKNGNDAISPDPHSGHIYSAYEEHPIYNIILDKNKAPIKAIFWNGDYFTQWSNNQGYYDDFSGELSAPSHYDFKSSDTSAPTDITTLTYDKTGRLAYDFGFRYTKDGQKYLAYPKLSQNPYWIVDINGKPLLPGVPVYDSNGNLNTTRYAPFPPIEVHLILGLPGPDVGAGESYGPSDGGTYNSNGQINFLPDDSGKGTGIVDPSDPLKPYQPDGQNNLGTAGALSLDFASSFDFGSHPVGTKGLIYAKAQDGTDAEGKSPALRDNFVQVTDKRGNFAGWTLAVKEEDQFKTAEGVALTGANLRLGNGAIQGKATAKPADLVVVSTSLVPGVISDTIFGATAGNGTGTNLLNFGSADGETNADQSVSLDLGDGYYASSQRAESYTAELTWILAELPVNG